ncbi:hypothetical protein [Phenylobacterium sp.]|uniref:hypothetical protein n=1 Tax=Phenylobacterium sp. TaxID=1871053 RepID=UPI003BAA7C44
MLKTFGYLVSSLSVLLLGVVSWKGVSGHPLLEVCLGLGMVTSWGGMLCRWLSYQREDQAGADSARPRARASAGAK